MPVHYTYFSNKYNQSLKEFKKKINQSKKENFEHWDDYIEWKAFNDFWEQLNTKIKDIENGDFQIH